MEARSIVAMLDTAEASARPVARPDGTVDLVTAYAIQAERFAARTAPLGGWKIGLTGAGARTAHGADAPVAGRIGLSAIMHSPATAPLADGDTYVEGELVFVLSRALEPGDAPFTREQVAGAIGRLHVGIEIVMSRFTPDDLPLGLLVADNCMADRLVIGDPVAEGWREGFADMAMTLHGPGDGVRPGSTAAITGDPLGAVTWLANWIAGQGLTLEAGQVVSSGTCTGVTPVAPGDRITVDLAGLGTATVEFSRNLESGSME